MLYPKKIKLAEDAESQAVICSDPWQQWNSIYSSGKKIEAEFRLMEKLPIDFHVLASLWIAKVGEKFEAKLADSARGNRLRRLGDGSLNILSSGSTKPYLPEYRRWSEDAFLAMESALSEDKPVVTLTTDVESFYHRLDVGFMVHQNFLNQLTVDLNQEQKQLHCLFINYLSGWAKSTPLERGLPVGLTASAVIANLALFELDSLIEKEVVPLYYGRYVDDIILVMHNTSDFKQVHEVWDWIFKRVPNLKWSDDKKKVVYEQNYLNNSEIIFAGKKSKVFFLSGAGGKAVVATIRQEIANRTSEWRALPVLPNSPENLESALLSVINESASSIQSLGMVDQVSILKAGFAIKLRDVEALSRALPNHAWKKQRQAFYDSIIRNILVLPTFFDFYNYFPRIVSLAIHCGDFVDFQRILDSLTKIMNNLKALPRYIKAVQEDKQPNCNSDVLDFFRKTLNEIILEAVKTAFPSSSQKEDRTIWASLSTNKIYTEWGLPQAKQIQSKLFSYIQKDLAYRPLKQYLLPKELTGLEFTQKNPALPQVQPEQCFNTVVTKSLPILSKIFQIKSEVLPSGIFYPVRPFSVVDLYLVHTDAFSPVGIEDIETIILAMRGYMPVLPYYPPPIEQQMKEVIRTAQGNSPLSSMFPSDNQNESAIITIPDQTNQPENRVRIAISSWKTDGDSWIAAVSGNIDPDRDRLERLNRLVNQVLRCKISPHYLIFPELSIPAHWFLPLAGKLRLKGISLICGVEYLHKDQRVVHNQVWAALTYSALEIPTSIIYRQDKQRPAPHEEDGLFKRSKKNMSPQLKAWGVPPIIRHGDFHFAILICSELTNINYRASLRGKIDALFVPEWNQDTETFNALVESAALDIHAYIIQCNDRQYGDSRIRAPYKDNWRRDLVRIKGGIEDYFVIGEIDIDELRAFQSNHRSPEGPFKPVPDGFEISESRKTLPKGGKDD